MKSENARPETPRPTKPTFKQLAGRMTAAEPSAGYTASVSQHGPCEAIKAALLGAAAMCVEHTPACPEQARALDKLDEAMLLFCAAVARHG